MENSFILAKNKGHLSPLASNSFEAESSVWKNSYVIKLWIKSWAYSNKEAVKYNTFAVILQFCTFSLLGNIMWELCHCTEKAVAPHSSTLAWKIPWMEKPGRLQSMWSLRVGHGWATSLWLFTFMHWRRKWQPTPVFLPGESQGRGSLVGCHLWSRTESDTTEAT